MSAQQVMPDWLAKRAQLHPERLAIHAGPLRWTFADLNRAASVAARRLLALGIRHGDRVALLLRNGPDFAALVHAASRCGAVLVPLNLRLSAAELAWQINDAGARLLVYDAPNADLAHAIQREAQPDALPSGEGDGFRLAQWRLNEIPAGAESGAEAAGVRDALHPCNAQRHVAPAIDLAAVHTIIYTSGTTGRPKGAMLTYGNHWWSAVGSMLNLGLHDDDHWLAVLPFFHVGGLSILMRGAIYGIPVVIHDAFDPHLVNRAIDDDGVTIISVVSVMLQRMLDERGSRPYPPTLRCVLLGGGPAPRPLLDACARRGVPVVQTYGMTETASQVVTLAPSDALRKLGSAGKPLLPNELRIDRAGTDAAPGEIGEIVVRGPSVTKGYVNRPDVTAQTIRDGWLHTGDLGYLDDEGYLFVVDRRDDLIISGGENIYPAEVEAALVAHPDIAEAAVVGLRDDQWGQVPVAVVVPRSGVPLDVADVIAFCDQRLARYKVPRRIQIAASLPRNAAGKLQRHVLRRAFREAGE